MDAEKWPQKSRTMEEIRRKLQKLLEIASPIGDRTRPPNVKRAKRIKRMIVGGAGIGEDIDDDLDLPEESLQIFTERIVPSGQYVAE